MQGIEEAVQVSDTDEIVRDAEWYRQRYAAELARERPIRETFILSYPKSGRTWHRALLGSYLAIVGDVDPLKIFKLDILTRKVGLGGVWYTHNGANFVDDLDPDEPLVATPDLWSGKRVILITRDVRDILVSAWHHSRFREQVPTEDMPGFIRNRRTGVEKILIVYNRWHAALPLSSDRLILSYEDLHRDPVSALRRTLVFVGLDRIDEDALVQAVENCRFETMRDRELEGVYRVKFATTNSPDERARKARVGKIGGYVDHLDAADLAFIADAERRLGNPFA